MHKNGNQITFRNVKNHMKVFQLISSKLETQNISPPVIYLQMLSVSRGCSDVLKYWAELLDNTMVLRNTSGLGFFS